MHTTLLAVEAVGRNGRGPALSFPRGEAMTEERKKEKK
jgi:hypothetical protein